MHSVEEIRKILYQGFGAIGMSDPGKTYLANHLSKPIFLTVLTLLALSSVLYVLPELRTYIPLAREKIAESATSTAVTITTTDGGVFIGGDTTET